MIADLAVVAGALLLTAALGWFFFGPKKARSAELVGDVQEVRITVKGGYSPDLVRVRQGVPLRIVFDRQESGECTSRVVFPDFSLNQSLPAYAQTQVSLLPGVRHGFLVVVAVGLDDQPAVDHVHPTCEPELAGAGDVSPHELARYCIYALAAASSLPTEAAVQRLVAVTLAGCVRVDGPVGQAGERQPGPNLGTSTRRRRSSCCRWRLARHPRRWSRHEDPDAVPHSLIHGTRGGPRAARKNTKRRLTTRPDRMRLGTNWVPAPTTYCPPLSANRRRSPRGGRRRIATSSPTGGAASQTAYSPRVDRPGSSVAVPRCQIASRAVTDLRDQVST